MYVQPATTDAAASVAAYREARQIAQPLFDQALEAIKKTSPHFVPADYKCVWIADGQPTGRCLTWDSSSRCAGISEDDYTLAQQYCDEQVKFCLENHLDKGQRDDVLIVITGYAPVDENTTSFDEKILESVRKNAAKTAILGAYCYFQSALK